MDANILINWRTYSWHIPHVQREFTRYWEIRLTGSPFSYTDVWITFLCFICRVEVVVVVACSINQTCFALNNIFTMLLVFFAQNLKLQKSSWRYQSVSVHVGVPQGRFQAILLDFSHQTYLRLPSKLPGTSQRKCFCHQQVFARGNGNVRSWTSHATMMSVHAHVTWKT